MTVVKSFSVPDDVAKYLDGLPRGQASAVVTSLLRRHMLSEQVEKISGRSPTPEQRQAARVWARSQLQAAREAVELGAYDEVRRQMGWTS
ncbi:MAG TPA: hypothetical protein VF062_22075 [Candidatus Limnocylindrales bacterium]